MKTTKDFDAKIYMTILILFHVGGLLLLKNDFIKLDEEHKSTLVIFNSVWIIVFILQFFVNCIIHIHSNVSMEDSRPSKVKLGAVFMLNNIVFASICFPLHLMSLYERIEMANDLNDRRRNNKDIDTEMMRSKYVPKTETTV
ncbi:hypothetical protein PRIPAC_76357 [Pristionchus pacificus]|uniref:Uncharacterized protein n=1 Tax=Pristionchus pacificus TaxID=54126 RepID=A0A2A6D0N6_PRIPA|nr:hypothetical protein PRIPAC_76357 [Pristionchus pacificus]|eukprot:PDM83851.1 hypothetical protein PRIPAC_30338 [Pristionchus pacificus]